MAKVFISYRHLGGAAMGQLISDRLKKKRHSVFFDRDSLIAGKFPDKIMQAIEACDVFLLILPENGLDRCLTDPEDWVRKEIRHALKCQKSIIPIFLRGFSFPNGLPEDIKEVTEYHGMSFEEMDCFEEKLEKLCNLFPATGIRKLLGYIGAFFKTLGKWTGKLLERCWRFALIRCAILLFLVIVALCYSIGLYRSVKNIDADQCIEPKLLYRDNRYTMNVPITPDNKKIALFDGNGQIFLSQVVGNKDANGALGVLETSFQGRSAMVGFPQDSKYCCIVCDDKMEVFDLDKSVTPIKQYQFAEADPDCFVSSIFFGKNISSYTVLWSNKETGSLTTCSVYAQEHTLLGSFHVENYECLGSAHDRRYILFWDANEQEIKIIDTVGCVEGTLASMGEGNKTLGEICSGNIDQDADSHWNFDKNGLYTICYHRRQEDSLQTRVAVVELATGNEVFSEDFWINGKASFDREDSFVIYHLLDSEEWELRRVRFLDNNDAYDALLTETELKELLGEGEAEKNSFPEETLNFFVFRDTDYLLVAYKCQLHLINMETKRKTARSDRILDEESYVTGYRFVENTENIITLITPAETAPETVFDYEWFATQKRTAVRFSYENVDGKIVVQEDANADQMPVIMEICLLVLSVAGILFFLYIGRRVREKDRNAVEAL